VRMLLLVTYSSCAGAPVQGQDLKMWLDSRLAGTDGIQGDGDSQQHELPPMKRPKRRVHHDGIGLWRLGVDLQLMTRLS